jgi:small subunit ribosomal protein S20
VLQIKIFDVNIFANIDIGNMGAILVNLAVCVHFIESYFRKLTVANNKSALKRAKIAERNRLRNKAYKSAVKTLMKKYYAALEAYTSQPTDESKQEMMARMSEAYSKIDKAVKRGVLHTNNGARKKSRLAQRLKSLVPATA